MVFPVPVPGLVIRYSYLWASEHARGQEEGVKDRPSAIVLTSDGDPGAQVVTEANRFTWPGPDLRPSAPGDAASVTYGPLPYGLFEDIRLKFITILKARMAATMTRTE